MIVHEHYLSRKPLRDGTVVTFTLAALLFLGSFAYWNDIFGIGAKVFASRESVFGAREFFRAWTTLFAHGDIGHLLSNLVLFVPFSVLLYAHFGTLFFPLAGFLFGGIINLIVLATLPAETHLIGVSGVVYWMGASWITLSFLIQRHEKRSTRLLKAIGVSAVLFLPETYAPNVSYLAHFLGYAFGLMTGGLFYALNREYFWRFERVELKRDDLPVWAEEMFGSVSREHPFKQSASRLVFRRLNRWSGEGSRRVCPRLKTCSAH